MPLATYKDRCIDAADPHALSAFWGPLLGWEAHPHDDGASCLRVGDEDVRVWVNKVPEPKTVKNRLHPDDGWSHVEGVARLPFECLVFQPVPEEKTTKNRIHIDVTTHDLGALVAAGARLVHDRGDGGIDWSVMIDPAGNEFCAFTST